MADLNLKLILSLYDKVTTPLQRVMKSGSDTSKVFQNTQKALKALNGAQKDAESFEKLKERLDKQNEKLGVSQERFKALQEAIQSVDSPTQKQIKDYSRLTDQITKNESAVENSKKALGSLKEQIEKAGGSTEHLGKFQEQLKEKTERTTKALEREADHLDKYHKRMEKLDKVRGMADKFASVPAMITGAAAAAPVVGMAHKAIEREDSIAEVKKVAKMTTEQTNEITNRLKEMANNGPAALGELSETLAVFFSQGIGVNQHADGHADLDLDKALHFTDKSNKAGVALGMDREGTASLIGHMLANGYEEKQVDLIMDQLSVLTNKHGGHGEYNREIFSKNLPIAKNAHTSLADLAALGTMNDRAGLEADVASTGIQHLMAAMTVGKGATKSQQKAFKSTGHSAQEWQQMMSKNGGGDTFIKLFESLQKIPEIQRGTVLNGIFGKEGAASIATMANNVEEFKKYRKDINDANMLKNDGVNNEYLNRIMTTNAKLAELKNNIDNLAADLGTELLPTIKSLAESFGHVIQLISAFSAAHPKMAKGIVTAATVIGPFILGLASMGFAIRTVTDATKGTMKAFKFFQDLKGFSFAEKIVSGIKKIGGAFSSVCSLFTANPIILAISLIVIAIAAVAYIIYRNWDTIGPIFKKTWQSISKYTGMAVDFLKTAWGGVTGFFGKIWNYITRRFHQGLGGIIALLADFSPIGILYSIFANVANSLGYKLPKTFSELGSNIIHGLIDGLVSMGSAVKDTISDLGNNVIGWFKEKLGIHSPSLVFHGLGGFIIEGLNNGISDNADHPVNRIKSLAEQVTAAFQPNLAFAGGQPEFVGSAFGSKSGGAVINNRSHSEAPVYFTVHGAPHQSEEELAMRILQLFKKAKKQDEVDARLNKRASYSDHSDWND
ncbi:phage tail tape measure protein [Zymomonas mobilis]|uniref:phage tail tape measure protein n=1 Tax=Zymomonas mobilis TaxID=542 RepID=UPI0039EA6137